MKGISFLKWQLIRNEVLIMSSSCVCSFLSMQNQLDGQLSLLSLQLFSLKSSLSLLLQEHQVWVESPFYQRQLIPILAICQLVLMISTLVLQMSIHLQICYLAQLLLLQHDRQLITLLIKRSFWRRLVHLTLDSFGITIPTFVYVELLFDVSMLVLQNLNLVSLLVVMFGIVLRLKLTGILHSISTFTRLVDLVKV